MRMTRWSRARSWRRSSRFITETRGDQARGKLDLAEVELKRQEVGLAKLKKEIPLQIDVAKQTLAATQTEEARAKDALKLTTDEVQKTIDESEAAVEVAKANLTLAKQEYDRFTELAGQ